MSNSFERLAFQGLKAYTQRTLGYTDASELCWDDVMMM